MFFPSKGQFTQKHFTHSPLEGITTQLLVVYHRSRQDFKPFTENTSASCSLFFELFVVVVVVVVKNVPEFK